LNPKKYKETTSGFDLIDDKGTTLLSINLLGETGQAKFYKQAILKKYLGFEVEEEEKEEAKYSPPLSETCLRKYTCSGGNCVEKNTTGTYGCVRCSSHSSECSSTCPNHAHYGFDLTAQDNTECYAIYDGEIVKSGNSVTYGNYILLKFSIKNQTKYAYYAHLNSIVKSSGKVKSGEFIGLTGHTGTVAYNMHEKERHLHIEIRLDDIIGFRKFTSNEDPGIIINVNCFK
jgi:hypothetical protein